jgi:hypothetical protein
MKHKYMVLGLLVGALIFACACGMFSSLLGGKSSGTVSDLWADVPRMDGLTKTDLDMPLAARLAMQAIMQGRINYIAFTTDATPQAVLDFYTKERMAGQGWESNGDNAGCYGNNDTDTAEGTVCLYTKSADGKNEILGIIAGHDDSTNKTAIFFARVDATDTTPTPGN